MCRSRRVEALRLRRRFLSLARLVPPRLQVGFFSIVVAPLFRAFTARFTRARPLVTTLNANFRHWQALAKQTAEQHHAPALSDSDKLLSHGGDSGKLLQGGADSGKILSSQGVLDSAIISRGLLTTAQASSGAHALAAPGSGVPSQGLPSANSGVVGTLLPTAPGQAPPSRRSLDHTAAASTQTLLQRTKGFLPTLRLRPAAPAGPESSGSVTAAQAPQARSLQSATSPQSAAHSFKVTLGQRLAGSGGVRSSWLHGFTAARDGSSSSHQGAGAPVAPAAGGGGGGERGVQFQPRRVVWGGAAPDSSPTVFKGQGPGDAQGS